MIAKSSRSAPDRYSAVIATSERDDDQREPQEGLHAEHRPVAALNSHGDHEEHDRRRGGCRRAHARGRPRRPRRPSRRSRRSGSPAASSAATIAPTVTAVGRSPGASGSSAARAASFFAAAARVAAGGGLAGLRGLGGWRRGGGLPPAAALALLRHARRTLAAHRSLGCRVPMTRMQRLIVLAALAATLLAAASAAQAATPRAPRGFFGVMWDRAAMDGQPGRPGRAVGAHAAAPAWSPCASCSRGRAAQPEAGGRRPTSPRHRLRRWSVAARARRSDLLPVVLVHARLGGEVPGAARLAARVRLRLRRLHEPGSWRATARREPSGPSGPTCPGARCASGRSGTSRTSTSTGTRRTTGDAWAPEYVELLKAGEARHQDRPTPARRSCSPGSPTRAGRCWRRAYRAGARGAFDVATINLFTGRPGFVMAAVRLTRRVLRRYHEPRKPIWVTETTFPAAKGARAAARGGLEAPLVHHEARHGEPADRALPARRR